MGLFSVTMICVAHASAILVDWLLILLLLRLVPTRWRTVLLTEMDDAARPLVDRALRHVERLWNRVRPSHSLRCDRRIPAAVIALSLMRLLLAAVTGLVVTVG